MNAPLRRRISRARRALDFATAHPLADSGYTTVVNRLKAEIDRADSLGRLQSTGGEREHAAVIRRQDVKSTARKQLLRRLCRVAELAAEDQPDLANKFILPPRSGGNRAYMLKAQAMLADAIAAKDALSALGLGDTFIADLTQAVADLDTSTANAHAGRNDHVGATGGLPAIVDRCDTDVDLLDTFILAAFAKDDQSLAAWRSAKNLVGPFKSHAVAAPPVAPEPQPVAVQPVVAQPAADPPAGPKE